VNEGQRRQSEKSFHTKSQGALVKTACSIRAISDRRECVRRFGVRPRSGLDKKLIVVQNLSRRFGWTDAAAIPKAQSAKGPKQAGELNHLWTSRFALENPQGRAYNRYVNIVMFTMST